MAKDVRTRIDGVALCACHWHPCRLPSEASGETFSETNTVQTDHNLSGYSLGPIKIYPQRKIFLVVKLLQPVCTLPLYYGNRTGYETGNYVSSSFGW